MARNQDLDGLRGISALFVALGHSATFGGGTGLALGMTPATFSAATWTDAVFRVLHLVFHADAAVVVFFVLSGLVLTHSLRRSRNASLTSYVIRRAFRLLPVSIASALIVGALVPTSTWEQIIGAAFLYDTRLNGVLWTLQIEVAGSALIFALWYARTLHIAAFVLLCIGVCAMATYHPRPVFVFLPAFALGALVADLPRTKGWPLILPVALAALLTSDFFLGVTLNTRWLQIAGATGVVAYLSQHTTKATSNPISAFLGRVSYPFYLLHLAGALIAVRLGLMKIGLPPLPLFAAHALSSVTFALALAWLVRIAIELPGIKTGGWVSERTR
jgi:peptidoglycan/LPS O-acetylase OafA/YrhL